MASAKLAKSTVNQSQMVTASTNQVSLPAPLMSRRANSMLVMALPTSTTNITGFLSCQRGSSFLKESSRARRKIAGSKIELPLLPRVFHCFTSSSCSGEEGSTCEFRSVSNCVILERPPRLHQQVFHNRPQRVGREVGQRAYDENHTNQQANK